MGGFVGVRAGAATAYLQAHPVASALRFDPHWRGRVAVEQGVGHQGANRANHPVSIPRADAAVRNRRIQWSTVVLAAQYASALGRRLNNFLEIDVLPTHRQAP